MGYFCHALDGVNILDFARTRYLTWTSRVFTECCLVLFCKNIYLFRLANLFVGCSLFFSLRNLLEIRKDKYENLFLQFAILLYPIKDLDSAGWCATLMNYFWTVAAFLYVLSFIKSTVEQSNRLTGTAGVLRKIIFVPALLYTLNVEQTSGALFLLLLALTAEQFIKNKKIDRFCLALAVLSVLAMLYIYTCPGNAGRKVSAIGYFLKAFPDFTLKEKLYAGSLLVFDVFFTERIVFFVLAVLLCAASFRKSKNILYRSISLVPAVIMTIYIFYPLFLDVFPRVHRLLQEPGWGIETIDWHEDATYAPVIVLFAYLACTWAEMLFLCKDDAHAIVLSMILPAGFLSLLVLGFSPTVFASGRRTAVFFYFLLLFFIGRIWKNSLAQKQKTFFFYLVLILGSLSCMNQVIKIFLD